jgi:hypothetical protein
MLGGVLGFGLHHQTETQRLAGREAFMAEKARRWDKGYAHPPNPLAETVVGVAAAASVAGAYELIAAGLYRIFKRPAQMKQGAAKL